MNQFIRFPIEIISSGIIEFMNTCHFRVYACLDAHKDRDSWQAFPSLEVIRKETKLTRNTVQRAIKDLIEWDLMKKVRVRKKKGKGYRIIYTIIKEPHLKKPLKKAKEKMSRWEKQKRDIKGKFTGLDKPYKRAVLKRLDKPKESAVLHKKNHKQPYKSASTTKPYKSAYPKPVNTASNQSSLSSIEPVEKNPPQNNLHKGKKPKSKSKSKPLSECVNLKTKKPKLDTSEKAWIKGIDALIAEKKKPKWPDDKSKGPLKETISTILKAR